MNIKFSPPDIGQEEIDEVVDTLKSGWITTGPKTKLLETKMAEYCGLKKSVALNSATAGLELVLQLLGIGEGDEVITCAYTYSASASVIYHVGAKIVLVDTAPNSYFLDAAAIERAITPKTKAIIPIDIAGRIFPHDALYKIIEAKRSLFQPGSELQESLGRIAVIADAAHSFGAVKDHKKSGQFADFTVFSLHAVKNITTAEGGIVVWSPQFDDEEIYNRLMLLSLHGQNKDALSKAKSGGWEYDIKILGYKYNMTDILASIGLVQLNRYGAMLKRRKQIIHLYDALLLDKISKFEHFKDGSISSGHLYLTRILHADEQLRNDAITKMAEKGIPCNVHYKPLPLFTAYKAYGFDIKNYPNAFQQYQNEITLPLHTLLTDDEVRYIAETYNSIVKELN